MFPLPGPCECTYICSMYAFFFCWVTQTQICLQEYIPSACVIILDEGYPEMRPHPVTIRLMEMDDLISMLVYYFPLMLLVMIPILIQQVITH